MGLFGTTFNDWKPKTALPPEQIYTPDKWYRDPVSKIMMPYEQSTLSNLFQGAETVPTIEDWMRGYMYPIEGMQIDLVTAYTHPMQYARRESGLHAWGDFLTPLLMVGGPLIGSQFASPVMSGADAGVNAGVFTAGELSANEIIAAEFGMSTIGPTVATGAETTLAEGIAAEFGMSTIGPTISDAGEIASVGAGVGEIGGNIDFPFGAEYEGAALSNSGAGSILSTTKDVLGIGAMGKSLFTSGEKLIASGKDLINQVFGGSGGATTPGNFTMEGGASGGGLLSSKTLPWFLIGLTALGAFILTRKGKK